MIVPLDTLIVNAVAELGFIGEIVAADYANQAAWTNSERWRLELKLRFKEYKFIYTTTIWSQSLNGTGLFKEEFPQNMQSSPIEDVIRKRPVWRYKFFPGRAYIFYVYSTVQTINFVDTVYVAAESCLVLCKS